MCATHVEGNDIEAVHCDMVLNTLVTYVLPFPLNQWQNHNIQRLALVGSFWQETEDDDLQIFAIQMLVNDLLELWSFMCFMTIHEQHNQLCWVDMVLPCKWNEHLI